MQKKSWKIGIKEDYKPAANKSENCFFIKTSTTILNQGSCKNKSIKKGRDLQTTTYN